MRPRFFFLLFLLGYCCISYAQSLYSNNRIKNSLERRDTTISRAYLDSLLSYKQRYDSISKNKDTLSSSLKSDPRMFKIIAPLTYYHSVAKNQFRLDSYDDFDDELDRAIDSTLLMMYIKHPESVINTEENLLKASEVREDILMPIKNRVKFTEDEVSLLDEDIDEPLEIEIEKPNFWTFAGDYYLQFLQNYISSNWYKGGESNYSMVASAVIEANYNNKQKVTFENKLELKLGFQTSRGDTLHSLKTSEDLIRYTGKFGLQAAKNWYYTLQGIAYTQFMRGYKANDPDVYSDFMSPFNLNLSLGMSYSVSIFKDRLVGSVNMAPIAMNFKYVGREALATSFGLKEGRHTLTDFGSELTCDLTWTFSELIKWQTRLYFYTTYSRTEFEWENTFTFKFNKFISANLFLYPRFDDSNTKDDHHGYWQFKEYASLGFSYSF